ncbi:hypothetical protein ACIBQ1_15890 [Nonomuraea sp. NPDC050153]|uniref:hypothetical protein n=1 Tax=Nonomuraea sp. NPDC050153 TaxID=3364359 RepID=UPI003789167B
MRPLRTERVHAGRPLINRLARQLLAFGGALTVAAGLVTIQAPQALAADSTTYLNGATVGGDVAA